MYCCLWSPLLVVSVILVGSVTTCWRNLSLAMFGSWLHSLGLEAVNITTIEIPTKPDMGIAWDGVIEASKIVRWINIRWTVESTYIQMAASITVIWTQIISVSLSVFSYSGSKHWRSVRTRMKTPPPFLFFSYLVCILCSYLAKTSVLRCWSDSQDSKGAFFPTLDWQLTLRTLRGMSVRCCLFMLITWCSID